MVLAQVLRRLPLPDDPNLLVGLDTSDDAAVYRLTDDLAVIQTLDFFTPIVDDPYLYGQIAAANSLSDVYAMGGKPVLALNIAAFPACLPAEILGEILRGGAEKVREAGANTVGGHTITDEEPKYGLAVMGLVHPGKIWSNAGAHEGDLLYLTKALGTGILNTALKAEMLTSEQSDALALSMATLNRAAAEAGQEVMISGATDITGFGLIGHALEMAAASRRDLEINANALPLLAGVREMAEMGLIPAGAYRNRDYSTARCEGYDELPRWLADVVADPQTSGGLLLALPEAQAIALERAFEARGVYYAQIGRALAGTSGTLKFVGQF